MSIRARSPNYPALSLPRAIELTRRIYETHQHKTVDGRAMATAMGFSSLNGNSATAISALKKFSLVMGIAKDFKLTESAQNLLSAPIGSTQRLGIVQELALSPQLFREIHAQFPEKLPNEAQLRQYLLLNGFIQSTVDLPIRSYRETQDFIGLETVRSANGAPPEPISAEAPKLDYPVSDKNETPMVGANPSPFKDAAPETTEEQIWLQGLLAHRVSFRLLVKGEVGAKELGRLMVLLQAQKAVLEDS